MSDSETTTTGLTRKELLGSGAVAAAAALLPQGAAVERALAAPADRRNVAGMNIILFISDQERAIQHFPKNWLRKNLPGMRRLRRHGLSFERAFTSACMCSPSRATMMTGYFPAQHGVKYTLEENMDRPRKNPQVELPLPSVMPNVATVMKAAGYDVVYKGKWHLSKPAGRKAVPADLEKYGFDGWDPPDAGANQDVDQAGGGSVDNDGRYMDSQGRGANEGSLQYLNSREAQNGPFFMVISLVNPHDVLFYPNEAFQEAGYDNAWLRGEMHPPATVGEDLSSKPSVQEEFRNLMDAFGGKLDTPAKQRRYLNFYGNLMRSSDNYLVEVLNTLEAQGLMDDTMIIRTSDHGEMGLSHGGMRQKNFNFYEETTRVPLVYSNPKLYPRPHRSKALVSHVDLLPTLANLVNAPKSARANWEGVDYSKLVLRPTPQRSTQDYVVFTYDDFQSGQPNPPYPKPPNHIVSIRERRWKLAKYYDVNRNKKRRKRPQWEMYDLERDPLERKNLAHPGYKRTPLEERQYRRLRRKLARVQRRRLRPLKRAAT